MPNAGHLTPNAQARTTIAATPELALFGGKKAKTKPFPEWPQFDNAERQALNEVLESRVWWRTPGTKTLEFEQAFAGFHGAKHGIAVTKWHCRARSVLLIEFPSTINCRQSNARSSERRIYQSGRVEIQRMSLSRRGNENADALASFPKSLAFDLAIEARHFGLAFFGATETK